MIRSLFASFAVFAVLALVGCARETLPLPQHPLCPTAEDFFRKTAPESSAVRASSELDLSVAEGPFGLSIVLMRQPTEVATLMVANRVAGERGPLDRAGWATLVAMGMEDCVQGFRFLPHSALCSSEDDAGGSRGFEVRRDHARVWVHTTKGNAPAALSELSVALRRFDGSPQKVEESQRLLQRALKGLWQTTPGQLTVHASSILWSQGQRAGAPLLGTHDSLVSATPEALLEEMRARWRPQRSALFVVGDFSLAQVQGWVDEHLGSWAQPGPASAPASQRLPERSASERRALVLQEAGQSQDATILLAASAPPVSHDDWAAFQVLSMLMGGMDSSPLRRELRQGDGFSAELSLSRNETATYGELLLSMRTSQWHVCEALRGVQTFLGRLSEQGPGSAELASARAVASQRLIAQLDQSLPAATLLAERWAAGAPLESLATDVDAISAVTGAQVAQVAERWLQLSQMPLVVQGQQAVIASELRCAGWSDDVRYLYR